MCGFHTSVPSAFNDPFSVGARVGWANTKNEFDRYKKTFYRLHFSTWALNERVFSGSTYASFGVCLFRSSTKHDNQSGRAQQGSVFIRLKYTIHLWCPGFETVRNPTSDNCRPAFVFPQVSLRTFSLLLIKIYCYISTKINHRGKYLQLSDDHCSCWDGSVR